MSLKVENQISNSFSKVDGKECSFWKRMEFLKKNKEYKRIKKNRTEFLSSFSSHFMLCLGGQSRNCSTFQIIPLLWHSSNSGSLTRIPEKSTELLFLWLLLLNFRPNRNSNEFFSLFLRSNSMAGVKSTHAHEKKNEIMKKGNIFVNSLCIPPVLQQLHERETRFLLRLHFWNSMLHDIVFQQQNAYRWIFWDQELENVTVDGFILSDVFSKHFGKRIFGLRNISDFR